MFVVAGGSGQTGWAVADTLLSRGEQVRLLVREPSRVAALAARGATVAEVDLGDAAALAKAMQGARGVYLLVPPAMTAPDLLAAQSTLIAAMAEAVRASSPAHVVCLSSQGAQLPAGTGPVLSLHRAEQALRLVSDHVTFVRPCYFMESLASSLGGIAQGIYPTFLRAELPAAMVASRDVGLVAAEALLRGPRGHAVLELEGPQRYTAFELASELSALLARPIEVQQLPESASEPTLLSMGLPPRTAALSHEMIHGLNSGLIAYEYDEASRLRGTTGVREVLQRILAPAS